MFVQTVSNIEKATAAKTKFGRAIAAQRLPTIEDCEDRFAEALDLTREAHVRPALNNKRIFVQRVFRENHLVCDTNHTQLYPTQYMYKMPAARARRRRRRLPGPMYIDKICRLRSGPAARRREIRKIYSSHFHCLTLSLLLF